MTEHTCDDNNSKTFLNTYNGIKPGKYVTGNNSTMLNEYKKAYDEIEKKVALHYTRPSALSETSAVAQKNPISMTYDWSTQKYTATFTIENEYMDKSSPSNYREIIHDLGKNGAGFDVSYTEGSKNTKITVSAKKAFKEVKTVTVNRRIQDMCSPKK